MHSIKRIILTSLTLMVLLLALPSHAAAQSIETNRSTQLDILYEYGGTPIANAQHYIYKVGSITSSGAVSLITPYSAYPIDASLLSEDIQQAAKLLYHYILLNRTAPDAILTTDAEGQAHGDLSTGLYLVAPQKCSDYRGIFRSEPALVSLPYRASTDDPWAYQITYLPKCSFTPQNRIGTMQLYVTKKWEGVSEDQQPEEITVYLLRDNTIVEQVKLNDSNRWLYRWEELSEYYDWRVVEQPLSGYTVTINGNIGSVLLTNTADEIIPEETEPDETEPNLTETTEATESTETTEATESTETTETPRDEEENNPTASTKPNRKPTYSSGGSSPKLPQTGMLWWPVPVLLFLGIALIYLGVRIRRGADYEE